jgi:hypothetical protein
MVKAIEEGDAAYPEISKSYRCLFIEQAAHSAGSSEVAGREAECPGDRIGKQANPGYET